MTKIRNEKLEIAVGARRMGAYVARPDDEGDYPGVLCLMEIFGINRHIRNVCDRLAAEGYVVMAPDLFHRTAPGVELGYDEEGFAEGIRLMSAAQVDELLADLTAAHAALRARADVAGSGLGVVGFCFGGHAAYRAACELPFAATASFYGGGITGPPPGGQGPSSVACTPRISGRVLCIFGEEDAYIPPSDVEAIGRALAEAGPQHEVVVYPGAGHGFCCDERGDYDADAAADAWRRVHELFAAELASGVPPAAG